MKKAECPKAFGLIGKCLSYSCPEIRFGYAAKMWASTQKSFM
jgi:hypothetical protein